MAVVPSEPDPAPIPSPTLVGPDGPVRPDGPRVAAAQGDYFRGASVEFDRRRAVQVVLGLWIGTLVILLVVLLATAVTQNSRTSQLRQHGVPVRVTVTSCLAVASGTGETVASYDCHGDFTLHGDQYQATIAGSNQYHRAGSVLAGLSDPAHPTTLSLARSVTHPTPAWQSYIAPGVVAVLLAVTLAWLLRYRRRSAVTRSRLNPQRDLSQPGVL
jgi:hypothetical protein